MKKQAIFTMVTFVAVILLASCNNLNPKEVSLKNESDSLNYVLGLANGDGIRSYYMREDSTDKPIQALIAALDKAYKSGAEDTDEMYKLGLQIGNSFKQQKEAGLMGDSTLTFDSKLVKQGLINAMKGFEGGMTAEEADEYIRKVMMDLQAKRSASMAQPEVE